MKDKKIWACICSAFLLVVCLLSGTLSKWDFTYRGNRIASAATNTDGEIKYIGSLYSILSGQPIKEEKEETFVWLNSATSQTDYSRIDVTATGESRVDITVKEYFAGNQSLFVLQGAVTYKEDTETVLEGDLNLSVFTYINKEGEEEIVFKIDNCSVKSVGGEYTATSKGNWVTFSDEFLSKLSRVWETLDEFVSLLDEDQDEFLNILLFFVKMFPETNVYTSDKKTWDKYKKEDQVLPAVWEEATDWNLSAKTTFPTKPEYRCMLSTLSEETGQGYVVQQKIQLKNMNNTEIVFPFQKIKEIKTEKDFETVISVQEKENGTNE